jgi:DNA-binding response OmpR family regulator
MRILAVHDDRRYAQFMEHALREDAYAVDVAIGPEHGLQSGRDFPYDLILIELRTHRAGGVQLCFELRRSHVKTPILLLSDSKVVEETVDALDAGADDCLQRPFAVSELRARVRALIRRSLDRHELKSRIGDLEIDRPRRRIVRGGVPISLTSKEFALVELLMVRSPDIVTRSEILEHVWESQYDSETNLVDVYVYRVRHKIDDLAGTRLIHTIRGVGYKLMNLPSTPGEERNCCTTVEGRAQFAHAD